MLALVLDSARVKEVPGVFNESPFEPVSWPNAVTEPVPPLDILMSTRLAVNWP